MALEDVVVTNTMETDLRTPAGHKMIVGAITGCTGTYDRGGLVVDPAWFGLSEISYYTVTPFMAGLPEEEGDPVPFYGNMSVTNSVVDGALQWRVLVWSWYDTGGGNYNYGELPTGQPLSASGDSLISYQVIGKQ